MQFLKCSIYKYIVNGILFLATLSLFSFVPVQAATKVGGPAAIAPMPDFPIKPDISGSKGSSQASASPSPEEDLSFNLTDADIKGLNLSDTEAAELRQFFDALNNLSPTEKQELKDLGSKTEKEMRDKKLDPTNFDDLVKFMEEQEKEAKGLQPTLPTFAEEKPKVIEKPVLVTVSSPKNVLTLLREIEHKLESLLVKVKSLEALQKKLSSLEQEVSELRYFIKVMQTPDLVLLLATKEFESLHKHLEALHKALATYEPAIIARKRSGDVDDPYEMLGIEYEATPEQITQAYNKLKDTQSPEAVEKVLSSLDEKDRKKRLKEARLTWGFIQSAYETLIDPKERAIARKELKNKIEEEARHERSSRSAFEKLFDALTTAFYPHGVLKDIKGLLEKHKPQELELAKKTLEAEKRASERAKQTVRIEQLLYAWVPRKSLMQAFGKRWHKKVICVLNTRPLRADLVALQDQRKKCGKRIG